MERKKKGAGHDASQRKMQERDSPSAPAGHGWGGGGVGSPPRRFRLHPSGVYRRLWAAAVGLAALPALLAAPPVAAAPRCLSTPAGTGTLPTVTYDGTYTTDINCKELTDGLTLTVGPNAKVGQQSDGSSVSAHALQVNGEESGDNDVTLVNSGSLRSKQRGMHVFREGTGIVKVEHRAGGTITSDGDDENGGISVEHKGKEGAVTKGIHIISAGAIDLSAGSDDGKVGITASTIDAKTGTTIPIRIEVMGGLIDASDSGGTSENGQAIYVDHRTKGDITITVGRDARLGKKNAIIGKEAIWGRLQSGSTGNLMITHAGKSYAVWGIRADTYSQSPTAGNITIKTTEGSEIWASNPKKVAGNAPRGIDAVIYYVSADITLTHNGMINAEKEGIFATSLGNGNIAVETGKKSKIETTAGTRDATGYYAMGIAASLRGAGRPGDITIKHRGEIRAKDHGIVASIIGGSTGGFHDYIQDAAAARDATSTGTITIATTKGSKVISERDGIVVWHNGGGTRAGQGTFAVTIRGMVRGGDRAGGATYAGVHIAAKGTTPGNGGNIAAKGTAPGNGGMMVIGPEAHVQATSGVAVQVDAHAGPVALVLEQDQYGLAGQLEGKILNADSTATAFKARAGETGAEMALSVGDRVDMRGATQGVYDKVHRTRLMRITGGHEFKKLSETRRYHDRARVYEALPAVLLDLNGQLPYQERMAAPRDGDGLWARLAAGDGARRPARATTARGFTGRALAWDVSQYGFEGGLDFRPAATERLLLGVSLHARQGEATVAHGGTIDVSGFGGGVSATYRDAAGFYLDGRFSYTYFDDVDLTSRTRGAVQSDLSGHGYALGLEAGKRLGWAGLDHVALTPRARLVWSTVKLEDFADLAGVAGSGRVALETATSLKGGLGLLAETAFGGATLKDWTGDGGRLFGSLDVEHEFAVDRETVASGTALASEVQATWGRVGLGGTLIWTEGLTLSGEGFYATAGSDNTDFGGSLTLSLRF